MSVTYKLQIGTNSDGSVFIDSPVTGRIRSVKWAGVFTAGAGGIGQLYIELSRAATNQVSTNNPRGVISQASMATPAASQGAMIATEHTMDEPIRFGADEQ